MSGKNILISPCIQAFRYFCEEFRAPDIRLASVFDKEDDVFFGLLVVNLRKASFSREIKALRENLHSATSCMTSVRAFFRRSVTERGIAQAFDLKLSAFNYFPSVDQLCKILVIGRFIERCKSFDVAQIQLPEGVFIDTQIVKQQRSQCLD